MECVKNNSQPQIRLSIIVPVYNAEMYLERCVMSLLDQDISKNEYEIILVDDGSTDASREIAMKMAEKHDNIILMVQKNQGPSGARNTGLDKAKGNYIMFVDADDMLLSNVVNEILSTSEKNDLDVCNYRKVYIDQMGERHVEPIRQFNPQQIYDGRYALTHGANVGAVWKNLYSRYMIENYQLRFYENIYHQDVDFNLRMFACADRIMFVNSCVYQYFYNESAISRVTNNAKAIKHINDDFIIANHIRDFANNNERGKILKSFYNKYVNSMIISRILHLIKNKQLSKSEKLKLMDSLTDLRLYPIKGGTMSWKTSVLTPFINCKWLISWVIR